MKIKKNKKIKKSKATKLIEQENFNSEQELQELNDSSHHFKVRRRHYIFYNFSIFMLTITIIVAALFSFYILFNNHTSPLYNNTFADADKPIVSTTENSMKITIPHNNYFVLQENKYQVVKSKDNEKSYDQFYLDQNHLLDFYKNYYLKQMFHGPEITNLKRINIDVNPDSDSSALGSYTPYAEVINLDPSSVFWPYSDLGAISQDNRENNLKYVMQHEYFHHIVNTYFKSYNKNDNIVTSMNYDIHNKQMININSEKWNAQIINNYLKDRHYDVASDLITGTKSNDFYKNLINYLPIKDKVQYFPTAINLAKQGQEPNKYMASTLMNMFNSTNKKYANINANNINQNLSSFVESSGVSPLTLASNYYPNPPANYAWANMGYVLSYDEVLVRDYCQMFLNNPLMEDGHPASSYAQVSGLVNGYYEDYAARYNYLSSLYNYKNDNSYNDSTLKTFGNLLTAMNYGKTISYLNRNDNNYSFGGYSDKKYQWIVFGDSDQDKPLAYNHYLKLTYSDFFNNFNMKAKLGSQTKTISPTQAINNQTNQPLGQQVNKYAYQTADFKIGTKQHYLYFVQNTTHKSTPNSRDLIERVKLNANNWNGNNSLVFNGNGYWFKDNAIYYNLNNTSLRFELRGNQNYPYLFV